SQMAMHKKGVWNPTPRARNVASAHAQGSRHLFYAKPARAAHAILSCLVFTFSAYSEDHHPRRKVATVGSLRPPGASLTSKRAWDEERKAFGIDRHLMTAVRRKGQRQSMR